MEKVSLIVVAWITASIHSYAMLQSISASAIYNLSLYIKEDYDGIQQENSRDAAHLPPDIFIKEIERNTLQASFHEEYIIHH